MNDKNYTGKVKVLEEILDSKRNHFLEEIDKLIMSSGDFDKISEIQINMLSMRHRLIDYLSGDLTKAMIQAKTLYDKGKKSSLIEIKTKYSIKISTEKEKSIVIDADTRVLKEMIDLIDSQMYFVKEGIRTLDNLGYALKNRIEIYKFTHGE